MFYLVYRGQKLRLFLKVQLFCRQNPVSRNSGEVAKFYPCVSRASYNEELVVPGFNTIPAFQSWSIFFPKFYSWTDKHPAVYVNAFQ